MKKQWVFPEKWSSKPTHKALINQRRVLLLDYILLEENNSKAAQDFGGSSRLFLGLWAVGILHVLHHESSLIEKCTIENPSCDDYKTIFLNSMTLLVGWALLNCAQLMDLFLSVFYVHVVKMIECVSLEYVMEMNPSLLVDYLQQEKGSMANVYGLKPGEVPVLGSGPLLHLCHDFRWSGLLSLFGRRSAIDITSFLAIAPPFLIYPFVLSCFIHTWFSFHNHTTCILVLRSPPCLCV